MTSEPPGVQLARERAQSSRFDLSSDNGVGALLASLAAAGWPRFVHFVEADGARLVRELGPVDLVFADAAGGKIDGLESTIDALRPGGMLVVDDMDPARHEPDGLLGAINAVRATLVEHPDLVTAELDFSTGVVIATKCGPV